MDTETLETLHCPFCQSNLHIESIIQKEEGEVINGIVKCDCSLYPIMGGILNLRPDNSNIFFINLLRKGCAIEALRLMTGGSYEDLYNLTEGIKRKTTKKLFRYFGQSYLKNRALAQERSNTFCSILGNSGGDVYLKHRFSAESLWSIFPFIPILRETKKSILDLCCGTGHSSFIINNQVNPERLMCADSSFRHLYLARRFFVSGVDCICLNADFPLPFRDEVFSAVLISDAFHFIHDKSNLAKEIERVTHKEGIFLYLHVHTAMQENKTLGSSFTPKHYMDLFKSSILVLPERNVLIDYLLCNELNLKHRYSIDSINTDQAFVILSWKDNFASKIFTNLPHGLQGSQGTLALNPIYKVNHRDSRLFLQRYFPSEKYRKEYPITQLHLPEQVVIEKDFLIRKDKAYVPKEITFNNNEKLEELVQSRVLIRVPDKYF